MSASTAPLMSDFRIGDHSEANTISASSNDLRQGKTTSWYSRKHWPITLHVIIFCIYTVFFLSLKSRFSAFKKPSEVLSAPASLIIEYETRLTSPHESRSPFAGDPRPELDEAWRSLLEGTFVHIPEQDFRVLNQESVPLTDGSGYLAGLSVFHELHCLKQIKRFIYWDHYHPNATEEDYAVQSGHIDHCIEKLRLDSMCRGNPTLVSYHMKHNGLDGGWVPNPVFASQERCVKWSRFDEWSKSHAVNLVQHPELVPAVT